MENNKYKIIAIAGKSGVGKNYLMEHLLMADSSYNRIVSCTTRSPRQKEKQGIDYHFIPKSDFYNKFHKKEFLEYTKFNNWLYGTLLSTLDKNKINIGIFNTTGLKKLLNREQKDIDLHLYVVVATDKTRLIRQLEREEDPNVQEILRRYKTDDDDWNKFHQQNIDRSLMNKGYLVRVINNNLNDNINELIKNIQLDKFN